MTLILSSEVESEILRNLSVREAYKHMEFLVNEVGERLAGTRQIVKAAEYITSTLRKYGLNAWIDKFYIYHSYPGQAELKIIEPETRTIEAKPCCHISSTLPEGISGELIYVGAGSYEDYKGRDVRDKIVLAEMTWDPPRPEKARIAWELGAKALIIMNWGTIDNPVIQMGAVKSVWGNPTPENWNKMPQIPVISITRAAGEYLKNLVEKYGKVIVWLRAEATRLWVKANQPTARITGQTEEFVLVGGHLEAWGRTAICNSSGNSLMMELARVFKKFKDKLRRSVVFAFWDGHEIAEAAGSAWYVDNHWSDLNWNCIAYVNIDSPAIIGTSIPTVRCVPEVRDFLLGLIKEFWGVEGKWKMAYMGGDASFFGVGVPYISFRTEYTLEKLRELNYASLSPWLHSEADTIDKIDKDLFAKHLKFYAILLFRLCNSLIVPYDLVAVADELINHLNELKRLAENLPVNLEQLIEEAKSFKEVAIKLNACKMRVEEAYVKASDKSIVGEAARMINKALIRIVHELSHIMRTEAGRYGYDPYGYYLTGKPIPRVYIPIIKMNELDPNSTEYRLWETKLRRELNRVLDAIENSIDYGTMTLQIVGKCLV